MISPLDSRVLDVNSESLGVPVSDLMRNAGRAVADHILENHPSVRVLFVCGPGNNGGDGFAAASMLPPDRTCVALLKGTESIHSAEARMFFDSLKCEVVDYKSIDLNDFGLIVDCALGTGIKGTVKEPYRRFIEDANICGREILSVDMPSGLGTDLSIRPSATITFHDIKEGMTESACGRIVVADIGIPAEAADTVGPGDMLRYPVPSASSHKGQNGRLMVIAGGPYYGAPAMACCSALRTGADIVRLFTPESVYQIIAQATPVLMITPLPGDKLTTESISMLLDQSEGYDAVLIGPGLGTDPETSAAVRMFVEGCKAPMVIDADGITAVSGMRFGTPVVLTPHKMEFRSLGGCCDVRELAEHLNATIVLKGNADEISDGRRTRLNKTGTPAMTGAGTGDVLAGCISALLSKGMSPFDSACLGAFMCGKAGEYAAEEKSYGLIATDVIDSIPKVLRNLIP